MEIQPLSREDKKDVLTLFSEVTKDLKLNGIDQWDFFYPNRFLIEGDLKRSQMYGMKNDGKLIGIIVLEDRGSKKHDHIDWQIKGSAAWIHRLAVHPDYQGQGLGKRLLVFAEKFAQQKGHDCLRLDVYSANPGAVRLYEKAGYVYRGQIQYPMRKQPYLCYEKTLSFQARKPS
ncbi:GNAT family N-acetyltransferase [Falsibacillus pallidus]|uniref:Ribosomal protein S18 acetylase RimI-like enzyme n=1 Tax=Falsibacillus pallidus TaxID=493781 RepID=A0A370GG45_9BACI|nr:GNAT family N-acetyltransferase [Falsibacillus pallidus]RDI41364.1 ribosomal protein S18 acetylase RimI-like enzyme [Falsibacillus pallidus]